MTTKPKQANARLIAAAPELLEACKIGLELSQTLLLKFNMGTETNGLADIKAIKQAISKATGEADGK